MLELTQLGWRGSGTLRRLAADINIVTETTVVHNTCQLSVLLLSQEAVTARYAIYREAECVCSIPGRGRPGPLHVCNMIHNKNASLLYT